MCGCVGNALGSIAGGIPGGGSVEESNLLGGLEEQIDAWTWREDAYQHASTAEVKPAGVERVCESDDGRIGGILGKMVV